MAGFEFESDFGFCDEATDLWPFLCEIGINSEKFKNFSEVFCLHLHHVPCGVSFGVLLLAYGRVSLLL